MATIETRTKNGKTRYRVKIRLKGHIPQSRSFVSKTAAANWAKTTEAAMLEGRYAGSTEASRHTLGELVDRYIKDILPTKPRSEDKQAAQLKWWKDNLGDRKLSEITPALLAEYRDKLGSENIVRKNPRNKSQKTLDRKRGSSTVLRYMAALSHAFSIAMKEWGWVEDNPFRKVRKPKDSQGRVRFLSDKERDDLVAACKASKNEDLYLAVLLALTTGARKMETMGMCWKQIDFQRRVITVTETKNKETRSLPLVEPAFSLLFERSKVRRIDTDLVFPGADPLKPDAPIKPVDLRTPFAQALKQANIKDFRWHDLRHTAASYLAMSGRGLAEIADVLGHKTLQMVKRYSHLSHEHKSKVMEDLAKRMFG